MDNVTKGIELFIVAIFVAVLCAVFVVPAGAVVHVYEGQPIRAAINAAGFGETIIVHDGVYKENLVVNKSDIIIRSANGSSVTTISSNQTDKHVVDITDQTNVTLDGFTIRDAQGTTQDVAGIYMDNASECNISNNVVTNVTATDSLRHKAWRLGRYRTRGRNRHLGPNPGSNR